MTPTLRRAGGLVGMLATAGALVAMKGAGTAPSHTSALGTAVPRHSTRTVARTPAHAAVSGTATGQVADTPYGPVQVQAVVRNGRLVDVTALQMPSSMGYSQQVAAYAAPILRQEALTAQSAQIDVVSGATYTSQGYAQSLQSALDKLHVGA